MPTAKTKKVSRTSKTTKKTTKPRSSRSSAKHAPVSLSWKKVAAIVVVPFLAVATLAVGMTVSYASTDQVVVYDNISEATADSVASINFEERHIAELGSQVSFAGTERNNTTVSVLLTSAACESGSILTGDCTTTMPGASFNHDVTLNVYRVGLDNTVGARIATVTKSVAVPFRPSADNCGGSPAAWSTTDGECHTAKSFVVDFDVVPVDKTEGDLTEGTVIPMPDQVIITVAFNTEHEGLSPLGVPGPYNFLGMSGSGAPVIGESLPTSSDGYVSYGPEAMHCYGSMPGDDVLRLDPYSTCWGGSLPGFKVVASSESTTPAPDVPEKPTLPVTADECKKDNWKTFTYAFKNQGDCVSYTQNGKL